MALLVLLALTAQVGGAVSAAEPARSRAHPRCAGVRVTASDGAPAPRDMTFSSRETLDLLLRPRLRRNLPGEHLMELKVYTPGGFLYQVITLPFVGADPR